MVTGVFYKFKLRWKSKEMKYIAGTNLSDPQNFSIKTGCGESLQVDAVEEMEVLGVMLDRRGGTTRSMEHRLSKAEALYGQIAPLLRNKTNPIKE
eukprot:11353145-Karenia_brevis.AAC.1